MSALIGRIGRPGGDRRARTAGTPPPTECEPDRAARAEFVICERTIEDHIDGQWTVRGVARHLGVPWDWLYRRVRAGTVPAQRHPVSRHYLIADDPALVARLAAECAGQRARQEG